MTAEELLKALKRERASRKQAEAILEDKSMELYRANEQLKQRSKHLETEVEQRTAELNAQKQAHQQIIEEAGDIIYRCDNKGFFTYTNPIASQLFGYSEKELLSMKYLNLVRKDFQSEIRKFYRNCIQESIIRSYYEFPALTKDQKEIWIGQNVQLLYADEKFAGVQAVARDITERKLAETRLKASEEKYRGVLENMKLGLLEVDLDGRITKVFHSFCELTGFSQDELMGQIANDVLLDEANTKILEEQDERRKHGHADVYEVQINKKDGSKVWVMISGAPIHDDESKVIGSLGIHMDISEQKKMISELDLARKQADESRESERLFLAQMSHEIRTPLNAIIGMSHLLNDSNLSKKQKEFLKNILFAGDHLNDLLSDILDFSKLESGEFDSKSEEFNLSSEIRLIYQAFKADYENKGISFYLESSYDSRIIYSDKRVIRQVTINLLSNSLKYTQKGSVSLMVLQKNDKLTITVSDTGGGIPRSKQNEIFKKFIQIENNGLKKGVGLGLYLSRKFSQQIEGDLILKSSSKKGSVFEFTAPVTPVTKSQSLNHPTEIKSLMKEKMILIVEDNQLNFDYLYFTLKDLVKDILHAVDTKTAKEIIENNKPDVILMDFQLGHECGIELTQHLRNQKIQTPIIGVTANVVKTQLERALNAGMNDVLRKPFKPADLINILSEHFDIRLNQRKKVSQSAIWKLSSQWGADPKILKDVYDNDANYAYSMINNVLEILPKELSILDDYNSEDKRSQVANQIHKILQSLKLIGRMDLYLHAIQIEQNLPNKLNDICREELNEWASSLREILKGISELFDLIALDKQNNNV